jgi:5-formyltetrahydrofolate cyclo-ligase
MGKFQNNNELRSVYKSIRDQLSDKDIKEKSRLIIDNILALLESDFKGANIFLCFYPFGSEVNLLPLYKNLLEKDKALYFPISNKKEYSLSFKRVYDLDFDLTLGAYNIMEPSISLEDYKGEEAIVFTPGLVFDEKMNRVGYGAGYYDRFFERYLDNKKIGICFEEQICDGIIAQRHDVSMDNIVTDNRILRG